MRAGIITLSYFYNKGDGIQMNGCLLNHLSDQTEKCALQTKNRHGFHE